MAARQLHRIDLRLKDNLVSLNFEHLRDPIRTSEGSAQLALPT